MAGNAVLETLRHAWKTLEATGAPAAVMGGIALAAWEHVRSTQDVDLLIGVGGSDSDSLVQRLMAAGFRPKRQPPVFSLGQIRLIQLEYQPPGTFLDIQVDLLLAESEYQRAALARRTKMRLPGLDFEVSVLTCEDLILHKLIAGRIIDRADSAALLSANAGTIDSEYLTRWAAQLGLTRDLADVQRMTRPAQP